MCRFLLYRGSEMLMSDLLMHSEQSLIMQSYRARERSEPLNGDGFGVGWYAPEIDPTPCVFTSIAPAWSNRNLRRLAEKTRSGCFFAHVRAASSGLAVAETNCHPFQRRELLWMHNGAIAGFRRVRRLIRRHLGDDAYDEIEGTTDSEHALALFSDILAARGDRSLAGLKAAVLATIRRIDELVAETGSTDSSQLNFALTDGENVVVTRYASRADAPAQTLYVAHGKRFERVDAGYRMAQDGSGAGALIVASEPISAERSDWTAVPVNHIVSVDAALNVAIEPID